LERSPDSAAWMRHAVWTVGVPAEVGPGPRVRQVPLGVPHCFQLLFWREVLLAWIVWIIWAADARHLVVALLAAEADDLAT
jgi:hypothetical protein